MRLPPNCLILVADGRKMLLLRNAGTTEDPDLYVVHGEEQPDPPDHEQKSDLAGRRPAIGTPGQASVSETDYHRQTEERFVRRIADYVNGKMLHNELECLVVVAANRTLGDLRKHLRKDVQSRVVAEVEKVMTGYATDRIAQMLLAEEIEA